MSDYEQGWSSTPLRKITRGLARAVATRKMQLPPGRVVASITFDDVPDSAAAVGAQVLERRGARGTFYVAAGTCGTQDTYWRVASREQVRDVHAAGHEIGCHTTHHVNVQSLGRRALTRECDDNAALLTDICGPLALTSFAYPFGDLGLASKTVLQARFGTCRTIYETMNTGTIDLGRVGAIGLFDATQTRKSLDRLIMSAKAGGGWLVFYTHDIAPEPTFMGTSPGLLDETLALLAGHGVSVMTMRDALVSLQ